MNYTQLSTQDLQGLGYLESARRSIIESRDQTLHFIADVCDKNQTMVEAKVSMTRPTPESATVTLKTPFGNGRSVNGWKIENSKLYGTVTFERECVDKYGRTFWEPIWGLIFGHNEAPRSGHSDEAVVIPLDAVFEEQRNPACRYALYAIVFGVIDGPADQSKAV
jgi:hypothetical protein